MPPAWCSSRPNWPRSPSASDHELLIDVIRKTARKMSPRGLDLVGAIPLGDTEKSLLSEALDGSV